VAKQCAHCGKILPSDNNRCNNCGKVVPSSRPIKRSLPEEPPDWMKQLESSLTHTNPPRKSQDRLADVSTISLNRVQASNATTEDTGKQPASDSPELASPQEERLHDDIPIDNATVDAPCSETTQSAKPLTSVPLRELRVKVWGHEDTEDLSLPEGESGSIEDEEHVVDDLPTRPLSVAIPPAISEQPVSKPNHVVESFDDEEIVEDLPTSPLVAFPPETPSIRHSSSPPATGNGRVEHPDDIENIYTRPLVAQRRGQSMSPTVSNPGEQHRQALRTPVEPVHSPVPPVALPRRKSRKRLVLAFVLLFTLLVGGVAVWVIVFQPFSVPEVTKTTRAFRNTDLGVSLQYPQYWSAELDIKNGAVYFYDDNHTDQVNITAVSTGGQGIDQYIAKEVGLLGMTGQKTGASLSFAGASWQQVQGTVLQSGANNTATLLVTIYGGRCYAILQLAPSSTYAREDQLVFSNMRSSFQFV
jgi:hypothetical protein